MFFLALLHIIVMSMGLESCMLSPRSCLLHYLNCVCFVIKIPGISFTEIPAFLRVVYGFICSPVSLRKSSGSLDICRIVFRLIVRRIDREDFTWSLFPDVPSFPFSFSHIPLFPRTPKRPSLLLNLESEIIKLFFCFHSDFSCLMGPCKTMKWGVYLWRGFKMMALYFFGSLAGKLSCNFMFITEYLM